MQAADQNISLMIPDAKVSIALEGFLELYPNYETIADPGWVDPFDGSVAPQISKYTSKEWVTEKVRRNIVINIRRGLQIKANRDAKVSDDDSIIESL